MIGRTGAPVPLRTTARELITGVFANTCETLEPTPMITVSPMTLVPSGIVTSLENLMRAPGSLAPKLALTVPSLFTFPSRATRNGTPGQSQVNSVVVVVELVVVGVVDDVGAVEVVLVDVVLVVVVDTGAQPWTRKFTPSA